jgi:RNase P/RNase MRP subunit POP5
MKYNLSLTESEMLSEVIRKALHKYGQGFNSDDEYYLLFLYNRVKNGIIFKSKEEIKGVLHSLTNLMKYTDIICSENLIEIDELLSRICIELYEMI